MIPLFAILIIPTLLNVIIVKINSNSFVNGTRSRYALYFMTTAVLSCCFFLVSSGFHIRINLPTLVYAAIYAAIVIASLVGNSLIFRYASISTVNIITSFATMILAAFVGKMVFDEPITLKNVIRIAITLVAVFFVFVNARRTSDEKTQQSGMLNKKTVIAFLSVTAMLVAASQGSATLVKLYAKDGRVVDEKSLFFFTNVLLIVAALFLLTHELIKKNEKPRELVKMFTGKNLLCWGGSTVCSNVGSLLTVKLLATVDISIYTPVWSALGVIISLTASIIFREKLGIFAYLAALVACVAVII